MTFYTSVSAGRKAIKDRDWGRHTDILWLSFHVLGNAKGKFCMLDMQHAQHKTRNSYKLFVAEHCWKIQVGGIRERQWMTISSRKKKQECTVRSYNCFNEASKAITRGNSFINDYHLLRWDQRSNPEHSQYETGLAVTQCRCLMP